MTETVELRSFVDEMHAFLDALDPRHWKKGAAEEAQATLAALREQATAALQEWGLVDPAEQRLYSALERLYEEAAQPAPAGADCSG